MSVLSAFCFLGCLSQDFQMLRRFTAESKTDKRRAMQLGSGQKHGAILGKWTSEHRAGRGHVHLSAFAVCMNMFADRPVFIRHVQRGGSTHNLVAGRIRLEAAQSTPPKGRCNIYGWRLVAAFRVRPRTSESWRTCNRSRLSGNWSGLLYNCAHQCSDLSRQSYPY